MVVRVIKLNIHKNIYPIQLYIKYFPTKNKCLQKLVPHKIVWTSRAKGGYPTNNHCHEMAGLIRTLLFGRENLNELVSYLI